MRTWGRVYSSPGVYTWQEVSSDPVNGDDYVWLTTLIQVLKLSPGESPFYANYGVPAQLSVIQQVFPDYYLALTQAQFAPYFASLIINKLNEPSPTYKVAVVTHQGVRVAVDIPV